MEGGIEHKYMPMGLDEADHTIGHMANSML